MHKLPGDDRTEEYAKTLRQCCLGCGSGCYMCTYEISNKKCYQWNLKKEMADSSYSAPTYQDKQFHVRKEENYKRASTDFISGKWYFII